MAVKRTRIIDGKKVEVVKTPTGKGKSFTYEPKKDPRNTRVRTDGR
jgi:hypothetical protein